MMFKRLWYDETGFVNSTDLILASTILVLGMIVGLVALRNQVVQELSDTASAVGSLNQSYTYTSYSITSGSFSASVAGSDYSDLPNVDATIDVSSPTPSPHNAVYGEG